MDKKQVEALYPLSPAQQGMFYETERTPQSGIHIEQFICTLTGALDISAFRQAWEYILRRHSALRTAFVWGKLPEPVQIVMKEIPLPFEQKDWRGLRETEQREHLARYLEQDRRKGFKLASPPLMRLALFQVGEEAFEFAWTHHHILMDGWCSSLVMKEVFTYYHALTQKQALHTEASRPYKDYISWIRQQDTTQAETFWRNNLAGIQAPTPPGREVAIEQWPLVDGAQYGTKERRLSAETTTELQVRARRHHLTINTLLQGTWALLLSTYNQTHDIVFGITVSGRPPEIPGIETMVGLCINTLPLRIQLTAEQPLWSWLGMIQAHNLSLRQYEYSSAGQIQQWSDIAGTLPLYESLLVVENYPMDFSILASASFQLTISAIRSIGAQTNYPLTLLITLTDELEVRCVYDRVRFDDNAVMRILEHFCQLLEAIAATEAPVLATIQQAIAYESVPEMRVVVRSDAPEGGIPVDETASDPIVQLLQSIWQEILGLSHVGIHEDFFTLGGHSLLATQLCSRIRADLQVELPLRVLFEAPTIALQARRIVALQLGASPQQEPLLQPYGRESELPLSYAQQRLWFLEQLAPNSASYNTPLPMYLRGKLDISILKCCLEQIVERHAALRTTFGEIKGQPIQTIQPFTGFSLPLIDLTSLPASIQESASLHLAREDYQRPLPLKQSPLIRMTLLRLAEEEHVLIVTVHHIAFDAWSAGVFLRELVQLYEAYKQNRPSPLERLPIQYADFAVWQRAWLQGEVLEKHITYWKQKLGGASLLNMPTDHPRRAIASFRGEVLPFTLPEQLMQQLKTLSNQQRTTLFMTLLAAFQILLHRYTGQEDIVVGTDIANRTRAETEPLIGFFVNLLVLRTSIDGTLRYSELLQRVREMVLSAYTHQDLPFEKLIEVLRLERNHNQTPLVRVLFVMQNVPLSHLTFSGVTVSPFHSPVTSSKFDFAVFLHDTGQGLNGSINYSTDLFEEQTMRRLIHHFETLLQNIVLQPDACIQALALETEEDKARQAQQEASLRETHGQKLRSRRRERIPSTIVTQA